jgi:hypothetical protein
MKPEKLDTSSQPRPNFRHLKFNARQRNAISVFYAASGQAQYLHHQELYVLSDMHLRDRNGFAFLTKRPRGLRISGKDSFWLPIECAEREVERAIHACGDYHYAWKEGNPIPRVDTGTDCFLRQIPEMAGCGPHYIYRLEGWVPDGPEPTRHYLKVGYAPSLERVVERFQFRRTRDKWHSDRSNVIGRWAIPLGSGVSGRHAEDLFESAFATHCTRWGDTGTRYLAEYYIPNDTVSTVAEKLEARFPHPEGVNDKGLVFPLSRGRVTGGV